MGKVKSILCRFGIKPKENKLKGEVLKAAKDDNPYMYYLKKKYL